jgi:hypothetical protein
MSLRCKQGDLALVVYDEPGCESNIGRAVEVRGPVEINPRIGLQCWLIRPAGSSGRWRVVRDPAPARTEIVSWKNRIEHPDAWLLPIPPLTESDRDANTVPEEREAELVLARDPDRENGDAQS